MTNAARVEFRVLGPLEARIHGDPVELGGAKQRMVLAKLLLQADEVVSLDRLIDEVWGASAPPSAAHSIEAYVSRLRQVLEGRLSEGVGPTLVRRGGGYALELGEAVLDARRFEEVADDATRAAAEGANEQAVELSKAALRLWRGPALADVALGQAGRAEAERLEELRLRTFEQRFDAELARGRGDEIVGELQVLVGQNPYRERFVAQLMLALYRAGRQAEALAAYEQTRRRLDDELGLQPCAELQQLSAQIVRQEPELHRPSTHISESADPRDAVRKKSAKLPGLVAVGAVTALVMVFSASGSVSHSAVTPASVAESHDPGRVALVLPRAPRETSGDLMRLYRETLWVATGGRGDFGTTTLVVDEVDPKPVALERVASTLSEGAFDLVLWVGDGAGAQALAPTVRDLPDTTFVFVDASLETLGLNGVANASAIRFADEQASELAGYLSGLVAPRGSRPRDRADVVSVVAGPRTPQVEALIGGFERGVRRALPNVRLLVDHSETLIDRTRCELLANTQIDRGSDVVFAMAGSCALGALAVAGARGVWGIGAAELVDGSQLGSRMLAFMIKEHERAILAAVDSYSAGTLLAGDDVVLGLDADYAVLLWEIHPLIPQATVSKIIALCSTIRKHSRTAAS